MTATLADQTGGRRVRARQMMITNITRANMPAIMRIAAVFMRLRVDCISEMGKWSKNSRDRAQP
jgi:hypothetical protein